MKLVVSKELKRIVNEIENISTKDKFFILRFFDLIRGVELNKKDEEEVIRIKQTTFKKIYIGENKELNTLIKKMEELKIIYVGESYKVGSYPKEYRTIFKSEYFCTIHLDEYLTKRQITAYKQKIKSENYQISTMQKLELDYDRLKKVFLEEFNITLDDVKKDIRLINFSENKRLEKYIYSSIAFIEKIFTFSKGEKSDRIYTNLTLMPKKIR
ncbi:MAG: hypothetical protein ACRCZ2_10685, partial [Fusobacteriaceae bacterium]